MAIDTYKIEDASTEELKGILEDCRNILGFSVRNLSTEENLEYYKHQIKELQKQDSLITYIQEELEKRVDV